MKKSIYWLLTAALLMGLALSAGCAKEKVAAPGSQLTAEEQARLKAEEERRLREARLRELESGAAQLREIFENKDIHFDNDRNRHTGGPFS